VAGAVFYDLAKKKRIAFSLAGARLFVLLARSGWSFFCVFFSWLWCRFLHWGGLGGGGGCGGWGVGHNNVLLFPSNDVTFLTFFSLFYYVDDATLLTSSLDVNTSMRIRSCLSSLDLMVVTPLPLFGGGGIITFFRSRPMMLRS